MKVFTLGTGHRPPFDFTRILVKHGIEVVFDVRKVPESRTEHFSRRGLEELCSSQGINYVYLGNDLGGPRDRDYRHWQTTDEFLRGYRIIRNKIEKRVCCILCAEPGPERCHRRVIGDRLAADGIEVVHLLDENAVWHPAPGRRPGHGTRRPPTRTRGPRRRR